MSRLTNKNIVISGARSGYKDLFNKVYNKLGQLEDLEEELGCPLEVVFKALKQGYIYVDMGIFEHPRIKDIQKQEVNFVNFEGLYFHIGYMNDYSVALCGCGKTWWLKGDWSDEDEC